MEAVINKLRLFRFPRASVQKIKNNEVHMMKALVFITFGGPEVLEYRDVEEPVHNPDEILVKMKAIGLNFADIYRRKGNYHLVGQPPYILGYEGAGIVEQVGETWKV
jgi:NADPH:quinone reductase